MDHRYIYLQNKTKLLKECRELCDFMNENIKEILTLEDRRSWTFKLSKEQKKKVKATRFIKYQSELGLFYTSEKKIDNYLNNK